MALHPADVLHPADRAMREHLEAIPALPNVISSYLRLTAEGSSRFALASDGIRLGMRQMSDVYGLLPPICTALNIDEPALYLLGEELNVRTSGATHHVICLGGAVLERLTRDETQSIIARECGHILCDHMLFQSLAEHLTTGSPVGALRPGRPIATVASLVTGPMRAALMAWSRASELTADRVAVAFMGSPDALIRALLKLAGVPSSRIDSIAIDILTDQVADFDPLSQSMWDKFLQPNAVRGASTSMLAVRIRELLSWSASPECERAKEVTRNPATQPACHVCRTALEESWRFCLGCGTAVRTAAPLPELEFTSDGPC